MLQIVRDIHSRIVKLFFEGKLLERIDYIPIEMIPKTGNSYRCCVYRDRAAVRYRIIASLGFHVEQEDDECRSLASYAAEALSRPHDKSALAGPALTVLEEACNHCSRQQYLVTDACQGCIARPCATNCPKKAIAHIGQRAVIDPDMCIKCGKCAQVCPYHAIVNIPIPCVAACPVGAITPLPDGGKHFDWSKCIYCGKCQAACPFGAVMNRSQIMDVLRALANPNEKVIGMLAPAAAGHFGNVSMSALADAFKRAGFDEVLEVSIGADMTAEEEAAEFQERLGPNPEHPQKFKFMTTSCCPAYVNCVKKHIPEIEDAVSHTPSPMHMTAMLAKQRWPGCTVVFIGPCIAKLQEAVADEFTNYALTFAESMGILRGRGVAIATGNTAAPAGYEAGSAEGRGFPVIGGVAAAVGALGAPAGVTDPVQLRPVVVDGLSTAAIRKLRSFAKANPPGNLVEVMCCEGGCVAGPGCVGAPQTAAARVRSLLAKSQHHSLAADQSAATSKKPANPVIFRGGTIVEQ